MVGGVKVCGGRSGGVWWEEWRCVVGGVEVCESGEGVWEECGGRGRGVLE